VTASCPGGVASYFGIVAGHDGFAFAPQLFFEDDVNLQTLSSNDLFSDPSKWNAFRNRELQIGFNNGSRVGAYITPLSEVPEPTIMVSATVGVAGFLVRRNRRVKQFQPLLLQ
jgi:hypothetical protein